MKKEDFEKLTNQMQEKLGKENAGLIADDFGTLITDNNAMNKKIQEQEDEIIKLKEDKERLIASNGSLLQQVAMGLESKPKEKEKEENPKKFNFRSCFDEKGNFIK